MSEKIKIYAFYLDESTDVEIYGFRYLATQKLEAKPPRLASYDLVHVSEHDLIEYAKLVETADPSIEWFLFEFEGDETSATGAHALVGLLDCDSYEIANVAADEASTFEDVCWDIVLSRKEAIVLFEMPHPAFVPILGTNGRTN